MKKLISIIIAALALVIAGACGSVFAEAAESVYDEEYTYSISIPSKADPNKYVIYNFMKGKESDICKIVGIDFINFDTIPARINIPFSVTYSFWDDDTWEYKEKTLTVRAIDLSNAYIFDDIKAIEVPFTVNKIYKYGLGYKKNIDWDWDSEEYVTTYTKTDLKIYCTADTTGERYADKYEFKKGVYNNLSKGTITLDETDYYYTGSKIKPSFTVTAEDGTELTEGTDYYVKYTNNVKGGKATLTVYGKNTWRGRLTAKFNIKYRDISTAKITFKKKNYYYSGSLITPSITVTSTDGTKLKEGTDYYIKCSNNRKAGKATFTIYGKNKWRGKKSSSFTIKKRDSKYVSVKKISTKYYTKKAVSPALTVTYGKLKLKKGTDYTVTYSNNTLPGTATATVKLKGNYTGTKKVNYTIAIKPIKNLQIAEATDKSIKLTWDAVPCSDYRVYRYNSKIKGYDYIAKVNTNSYTDTNVSQITRYSYMIKAGVKPTAETVILGKPVKIGGYTMLTTPTMSLSPGKSGVTVKWSKNAKANGYEIERCSLDDMDWFWSFYFADFKRVKTITKSSTTSYLDKKANPETYYYYRVRSYRTINGQKHYSEYSEIKGSLDTDSILGSATLTNRNSYTLYDVQGKTTTTMKTVTLSDNDRKILSDFAKKHFTKNMSLEDKLKTTMLWINQNMHYVRDDATWEKVTVLSHTEAAFVFKGGQCAQYNGAMAAMMTYLGMDARMVMGYRGNYDAGDIHQHFWTETTINGITYIMEVGNQESSGSWMYFLTPYSYTSGYIKNCKNM